MKSQQNGAPVVVSRVNTFALQPCPASGRHSWLLAEANRCRNANIPEADAERLLTDNLNRPPKPANEVRTAVRKAYNSTYTGGATYRRRVSLNEIQPDLQRLERFRFTAKVEQPASWRHWLWERSNKRPECQNAYSFLKHIYQPGEIVHCFDCMESKAPAASVRISEPQDCRVPRFLEMGGRGAGVWYLANPVDGEWHPMDDRPGELSCRNESALTDFRFMVLESDIAPPDLWLPFITRMPARIAAIYTSGGRSIHALVVIDAHSKMEFDAIAEPLKRPLKRLGGDPACLSAVRLTRLPGCHRPEKGGFQKLLYLHPNPPLCPIADLPPKWPRKESLERWRTICPSLEVCP